MKQQSDIIFSLTKLCVATLFIISVVACEDKKPAVQEHVAVKPIEVPVAKTVQASIEKVAFQLPDCKETHCPQIQIYRLVSNEPELNTLVDQYIVKYVNNMITNFDVKVITETPDTPVVNENSPINTLIKSEKGTKDKVISSYNEGNNQDLIKTLQPSINSFVRLSDEINALGARSQLNVYIKPQLIQVNDAVATVLIDGSNYMGGAHGSTSQQYINFDLTKQRYLNLEAVIKKDQFNQFNTLVYGKFKNWISEVDQTLDAQTYESLWPFKISENFYLDKDYLILQYGQYELGPYAVGLPRLKIPYQELIDILQPQYLPKKFYEKQAEKQSVTKLTDK